MNSTMNTMNTMADTQSQELHQAYSQTHSPQIMNSQNNIQQQIISQQYMRHSTVNPNMMNHQPFPNYNVPQVQMQQMPMNQDSQQMMQTNMQQNYIGNIIPNMAPMNPNMMHANQPNMGNNQHNVHQSMQMNMQQHSQPNANFNVSSKLNFRIITFRMWTTMSTSWKMGRSTPPAMTGTQTSTLMVGISITSPPCSSLTSGQRRRSRSSSKNASSKLLRGWLPHFLMTTKSGILKNLLMRSRILISRKLRNLKKSSKRCEMSTSKNIIRSPLNK